MIGPGVGIMRIAALAGLGGDVGLLTDVMSHNIRNYPFAALPPIQRDTFAATGKIYAFDQPAVYFISGGTQETNKIFESRIESIGWSNTDVRANMRGPGSTVWGDYRQIISCQMWADASVPANMAADSWYGIEYCSSETTTLPPNATTGASHVRLMQNLADKTQWVLIIQDVSNNFHFVRPFTVPLLGGQTIGEGHHVVLDINPDAEGSSANPYVAAYVDGVLRYKSANANEYPRSLFGGAGHPASDAYVAVGTIVYSGAMTGAAVIKCGWAGATVIQVNTKNVGSGI